MQTYTRRQSMTRATETLQVVATGCMATPLCPGCAPVCAATRREVRVYVRVCAVFVFPVLAHVYLRNENKTTSASCLSHAHQQHTVQRHTVYKRHAYTCAAMINSLKKVRYRHGKRRHHAHRQRSRQAKADQLLVISSTKGFLAGVLGSQKSLNPPSAS